MRGHSVVAHRHVAWVRRLATAFVGLSMSVGALAAGTSPALGATSDQIRHGPVGWETYRHPERLVEVANDSRTRQFSSFDRTGGNDDGFGGVYSCLRTTGEGRCVIAEHTGAGEIDSIWFTRDGGDVTNTGTIRIELDGATVVDAPLQEVVNGSLGAPFVHPLVANADQSSGGVYIKVPMPYRSSMRITTENNPYFYHVTYRQFASPEGVTTFDPSDPAEDVIDKLRRAGTQDPKPELGKEQTTARSFRLEPNHTVTLAGVSGPGALTELVLRLPQLEPSPTADVSTRRATERAPSPMPGKERWVRPIAEPTLATTAANDTEEILRNVRLRISFDGKRTVDSPLGEFFGSGLGLYPVRSYMFGMDPTDRTLSSWWLMPYARSAKVQLVNWSTVALTDAEASVTHVRTDRWARELAEGRAGYFRATSVRQETELGRDHTFLDVTGRGRVVGVTQTVEGLNTTGWRRGYLEGDERVFVDGSSSPDMHGTGTEDFYEGGWYFNRGAFTAPMTGAPVPDRADCPGGCTGMYRLMLAEGIDFASSIRFGIEHGPGDDEPAIEASTTYWYGAEQGQLVWSDHLDVGDVASEQAHGYSSTDPGEVTSVSGRYEGLDGPAEPVTVDARATSAPVSFRMAVAPANAGVVLRRMSDQTEPYQAAEVTVDGEFAGLWTQPLGNPAHRLLDDFFVLPASLTSGKRTITVELTPVDAGPAWSAADYAALSIRPSYVDRKRPAAVSGATATSGDLTSITLGWKRAYDDVYAPRYEIYASTAQGFTPSKATLVGISRTPGFVHDPHAVRQTWYYRIRAVDSAGRTGGLSPELSATTGDAVRIEAESLLPPVEATAPVQVQGNCCGVTWSGNAQLWFTPTTPGERVVLEFEVASGGSYEVTTQQTLARDYGINTLALDGQPIGEAFDAYHSPEVILSEPMSYGVHELSAGTHRLTVEVPDKNPESISYMAGFDYFQLTLVDS